MRRRQAWSVLAVLSLASVAWAQEAPAPEAASGRAERAAGRGRALHDRDRQPARHARRAPPSCARGGSAVDAMVAAQLVAEPGRAAILGHRRRRLPALLGRQGAAAHDLRRARDGADGGGPRPVPRRPTARAMSFDEAVPGGRSVGVPGTLALLELAHRLHGRLPWAELVEPAAELAERGFEISPRLAGAIADNAASFAPFAATRAYFLAADGSPRAGRHHAAQPGVRRRPCARSRPRAARRSIAAASATRWWRRCATRRSIPAR